MNIKFAESVLRIEKWFYFKMKINTVTLVKGQPKWTTLIISIRVLSIIHKMKK